jgi:predicted TIM-barrel fold metal-dependent hydrolase
MTRTGSNQGGLSRREFIGATAALAAAPRPARADVPVGDVIVDIHCHSFNSSDLPLTGFLAHYALGGALTDVSRVITPVPEAGLRKGLEWARRQVRKPVPKPADELGTTLPALFAASAPAPGVDPLMGDALELGTQAVFGLLGALMKQAPSETVQEVVRSTERYLSALYIASHDHATVSATMAWVYPEVSLFTPLLVDYDAWSNDHPDTPLEVQISIQELVAKLSMAGKIGRRDARFHPFVAFDPAREVNTNLNRPAGTPYRPYGDDRVYVDGAPYDCSHALAAGAVPWQRARPPLTGAGGVLLVRHAVERAGFLGVKMYPPVGFAALDNARLNPDHAFGAKLDLALGALYAYCEAEQVPITAHTSAANTYALGYATLVSPERWAPVLKKFPRLHLNLGHFGHDHGVTGDRRAAGREAWIRQAAALMESYDNVYADMSCSPLVYDDEYSQRYLSYLASLFSKSDRLKRRVMYGSDWWLNMLTPNADKFVSVFRDRLRTAFGAEVAGNIMGRNALRFLGFVDDANHLMASRSQARLAALYAGGRQVKPGWLL